MTTIDRALQDELRRLAHRLVDDQTGAHLGGDAPAIDWPGFAAAGLLGLDVPEHLGGGGATFAEVALVAEELGRAASAAPYLGATVLGVHALLEADGGAERDRLVAAAVTGDLVPVACLPAGSDEPGIELAFSIRREGGSISVVGQANDVVDAPDADVLVLLTHDPDADDALDGAAVVVVPTDADGVQVDHQPTVDVSRRLGRVTVDAALTPDAVWSLGDPGAIGRLRDRASLAVAADSVGIARGALERTVGYVSDRHQFGRAIGSFQAVKHQCADVAVALATSEALLTEAIERFVAGDPEASTAISMAAAHADASAVKAAGTAMQLHGGIGYTWEAGIHLLLKRATLNRTLYGSPIAHRARLARTLRDRHPTSRRSG